MSLLGGSRSVAGRLTLDGQVTSPFSAAIGDTFGDQGFRVGGLTGAASTAVPGAVSAHSPLVLWAIVLLLILAVAAVLVYRHARLQGRLVLKPPDQRPGHLYLPRRRSVTCPTDEIVRYPVDHGTSHLAARRCRSPSGWRAASLVTTCSAAGTG